MYNVTSVIEIKRRMFPMTLNYEALLKEQVMQHFLGNDLRSLKSVAQYLIDENKQDQQKIIDAYKKVNIELIGESK